MILAERFKTGVSWLARAVAVSVILHVVIGVAWWLTRPSQEREVELVNIELAPPPPKAEALPEEVAKPPESAPPAQEEDTSHAATQPGEEERGEGFVDAGVDAPPPDAREKKKKRPDAAVMLADEGDAGVDAAGELAVTDDGGVDDGGGLAATGEGTGDGGAAAGDDAALVAMESGSGAGSGAGSGSAAEPGTAAFTGSGSGAPGMDNQPAVDGAPTSAGTAANLLAFFPAGHQVTVMIRFDRLRKTEWAEPAEAMFKPMPDYAALFGARTAAIGDKIDTLVISTPRPRDATATTLVVHSPLTRPELRVFLANPDAPITWSATKGGLFGKRTGKVPPNDKRVLLSPWQNWFLLAQPGDLGGLTAAAKGNLDTIEAKAKLPAWLQTLRTIEHESGDDKRGPALVMTLAGPGKRYAIPDVGLGVTSLPSPVRLSLAMELVKQGWLLRGNIVFGNEADASEFAQAVQDVQTRITDSRILSGLLRKQHALNMVTGLSLARTGARVSYATSISIADARALLAAAAVMVEAYFDGQSP
ncbi:MAG: hypothetical protein HOV81_26670 [Kofleriaceae bacterium]|nr:hypothetical protein [Kofleriaceae bacterium]